jgi:hypothetical protein
MLLIRVYCKVYANAVAGDNQQYAGKKNENPGGGRY